MRRLILVTLVGICLCFATLFLAAQPAPRTETAAAVSIDTTLRAAAGHVPQFVFDDDASTYFLSKGKAGPGDHFTLAFDKPVTVKSIAVITGQPNGGEMLDAGLLEVSEDGKQFRTIAKFADGLARAKSEGKKIKAVRIRPTEDLKHSLAIREFVIESEPAVAVFKYPVGIILDLTDAPEMKDWAEKAARICEQQYPMICAELKSDGFKPPNVIRMTLRNDYNGVAECSGNHITGSVKYFKTHPADTGALVHETVHCVQAYRGRNPSWLVEGIADYIRFFKYEPGKIGRLSPDQARYDGSYRVTAAFLAFATEKYDKELVRKLNAAMREGKYKPELFKEFTGKTVQELDEEWRGTLRK